MPKETRDKSSAALILIDVINHFEFRDGEKVLSNALPMAARLNRLKQRCRGAGIPAIYVNDNFGQWRSDAKSIVSRCTAAGCAGKPFVEQLKPNDDDYFVLKPMHSAFFETPLETLLQYLGATSLILTGLATNSCIVCTAHDAKMRNFRLYIPSDCSAARTRREHEQAMEHLRQMVCASVAPSRHLRLSSVLSESRRRNGKAHSA